MSYHPYVIEENETTDGIDKLLWYSNNSIIIVSFFFHADFQHPVFYFI